MPNNITNTIEFNGEQKQIEQMLEEIKYDEVGIGSIDFNKIIPMPDDIFKENLGPEDREKYGDRNWYDWSVKNWGSKWNAYGYDYLLKYQQGSNRIVFHTAWSSVQPLLKSLSEKYPDIEMAYRWADEDFGTNLGERLYQDGEITDEYLPLPFSKEAYELAADIIGVDLESEDSDFSLSADESTYIYLEDDEYEAVEVLGNTVLFSDSRLSLSEIPKGMHLYFVNKSEDGRAFDSIELTAPSRGCGSIVTKEPIDFDKSGKITFDKESDDCPNFIGESMSFRDYRDDNFNFEEEMHDTKTGGMGL